MHPTAVPGAKSFVLRVLDYLEMISWCLSCTGTTQLSATCFELFNSCFSVHREELFQPQLNAAHSFLH
jgi:hypothetical protein